MRLLPSIVAVSFLSLSSALYAQSALTLYGVLDEGFMFNNNVTSSSPAGGRKWYLDSLNGINGSRWGLKGSEDLGGGNKAIFTLESGMNLNNGALGQGGLMFGRQAFVGLSSQSYGDVTLGRQYDAIVIYTQPVSIQGYLGSQIFQHPGDIDNTANSLRTNNAIRYASPSFHGLSFGAEISIGGVPGSFTTGTGYSAGASYANGPFTLGAGYLYFKNPTASTPSAGFFTSNASGTILTGKLNSGYVTANAYQVAGGGATYALGPALFGVYYSNVQYANISALGNAAAHFNTVDVGARWTVTPTIILDAAYVYTKGNSVTSPSGASVGNQHINQVSLLADYLLSKRTDVYAEVAFQKASGTSSTGTAAVANIGNAGDSSNDHQTLVRVAMRHRF